MSVDIVVMRATVASVAREGCASSECDVPDLLNLLEPAMLVAIYVASSRDAQGTVKVSGFQAVFMVRKDELVEEIRNYIVSSALEIVQLCHLQSQFFVPLLL